MFNFLKSLFKKEKSIAEFFNHDFKNGYFRLYDKKENCIYLELSDGYWSKREYDSKGNCIYFENSRKYWVKCEYDSKGNEIYFKNSLGFISKTN